MLSSFFFQMERTCFVYSNLIDFLIYLMMSRETFFISGIFLEFEGKSYKSLHLPNIRSRHSLQKQTRIVKADKKGES